MNSHSYVQYRQKRQHGTAEFPVAYFYSPYLYPQDAIPLHWHPECELAHVLKGTMELSADGIQYSISEGEFSFVYGEVLHGADTSHCVYETIVFSADRLFEQWPFCREEYRLLQDHKKSIRPELSGSKRLHTICQELFGLLNGSFSFPYHSSQNASEEQLIAPVINRNFNQHDGIPEPEPDRENRADKKDRTGREDRKGKTDRENRTDRKDRTDREDKEDYDIAILQNDRLPTGYQFQVIGLLYQLLGALLAEQYFSDPTDNPLSWNASQKIKNTLLYIEEHFSEPISLEQLAHAAGLNAKYLCRFFKAATLYTPIEYVNRYRIDQACRLLSASEDSITQIALRCGFHDTSYFIRMFRRYKGMTPSDYIKQ